MMQELLSKTSAPNVPVKEQEYHELRLDDLGFSLRPQFVDTLGTIVKHRFIVLQKHAAWSEIDGQIMWDDYQHDECSTHAEAELRYELRRAALFLKGFIYSDLEF